MSIEKPKPFLRKELLKPVVKGRRRINNIVNKLKTTEHLTLRKKLPSLSEGLLFNSIPKGIFGSRVVRFLLLHGINAKILINKYVDLLDLIQRYRLDEKDIFNLGYSFDHAFAQLSQRYGKLIAKSFLNPKNSQLKSVNEVIHSNYNLNEVISFLQQNNCSIRQIMDYVFETDNSDKFGFYDFVEKGYYLKDLSKYFDLKQFNIIDLYDILYKENYSGNDAITFLKSIGFNLNEILSLFEEENLTSNQITKLLLDSFTLEELVSAYISEGRSIKDIFLQLKSSGITIDEFVRYLRGQGYQLNQIADYLRVAGFTFSEVRAEIEKLRKLRRK